MCASVVKLGSTLLRCKTNQQTGGFWFWGGLTSAWRHVRCAWSGPAPPTGPWTFCVGPGLCAAETDGGDVHGFSRSVNYANSNT